MSGEIKLEGLTKAFGEHVAVAGIDVDMPPGEFFTLLGPSGCGKTTTLRMIAGFERPTSGTITLDGRDITDVSPNQRNVGMVFQSYALFPNMTVADNVAFGLTIRKRPKDQVASRVEELLQIVNLPDKGKRYQLGQWPGDDPHVFQPGAEAISDNPEGGGNPPFTPGPEYPSTGCLSCH